MCVLESRSAVRSGVYPGLRALRGSVAHPLSRLGSRRSVLPLSLPRPFPAFGGSRGASCSWDGHWLDTSWIHFVAPCVITPSLAVIRIIDQNLSLFPGPSGPRLSSWYQRCVRSQLAAELLRLCPAPLCPRLQVLLLWSTATLSSLFLGLAFALRSVCRAAPSEMPVKREGVSSTSCPHRSVVCSDDFPLKWSEPVAACSRVEQGRNVCWLF